MRWLAGPLLAGCLVGVASARAQAIRPPRVVVPPGAASVEGLDRADELHLSRVDALIENGQAEEAIESLRRIVEGSGERLVELTLANARPAGFRRYVPAYEYGTMRLASLARRAPQAFTMYQRQVNPLAERWLAEAHGPMREALLRRIAREALLSRAGDEALLRLGELALERGDYNAARRSWERIHPALRFPDNGHEALRFAARRPLWLPLRGSDVARHAPIVRELLSADQEPSELVYPNTDMRLADVRSRLALASILEGNLERAEVEIELLRQLDGDAIGTLGGREGRLTDLLGETLAAARGWPEPPADPAWSTLGGNAARGRRLPQAIDVTQPPLWSISLPRLESRNEWLSINRVRVAEDASGLLPYHPIVVDGKVLVQLGPRRDDLVAYELRTGKPVFPKTPRAEHREGQSWGKTGLGVPRYTLTGQDHRVYARTGSPLSFRPGGGERLAMPPRLVALDLDAEGKLLWSIGLEPPLWGDEWMLGGPPVTDGRQLFITAMRRGPLRLEFHVAALDPPDGRVRWRRFVCAAELPFDDQLGFMAHNLLTLAHGVVYCNTNQGAIAALDANSGSILWLTTYPRTALGSADPDRNDLHFYRDLNPCVLFRDVVIAAPADCNRLLALDATTGIPLWVTRAELAADVVHLLGVGADHLVASGECLYWFDAYGGQLVGQYPGPFRPAPGFARPAPRGYGRGLIAGGHVYWPTRDAILVFELRSDDASPGGHPGGHPRLTRSIPLAAHGASGGHLVVADGVLLVAAADRLVAFACAN